MVVKIMRRGISVFRCILRFAAYLHSQLTYHARYKLLEMDTISELLSTISRKSAICEMSVKTKTPVKLQKVHANVACT
jgi:hypothetical protein